MTQPRSSLTRLEREALRRGTLNFSDGHARQALRPATRTRLHDTFSALVDGGASDYLEAEELFLATLGGHTGQRYRAETSRVLQSASIGLAVVAKHLTTLGAPIGLVTPTFDSIPQLFRREGLRLVPLPEESLMPVFDEHRVSALGLRALVVVVPGNPTGRRWDREEFTKVVRWAAATRVELILDMSFRMLDPEVCWDIADLAETAGADVLILDDTGKTVPLFDGKVAVLTSTSRLAVQIGDMCDELLLAVSELDLRLLAAAMAADAADNEVVTARSVLRANTIALRRALPPTLWSGAGGDDGRAPLPAVAWLDLGSRRDAVLQACRRHGLELLPGDDFFWDATDRGAGHIRMALLRDGDRLAEAVRILNSVMDEVHDGG